MQVGGELRDDLLRGGAQRIGASGWVARAKRGCCARARLTIECELVPDRRCTVSIAPRIVRDREPQLLNRRTELAQRPGVELLDECGLAEERRDEQPRGREVFAHVVALAPANGRVAIDLDEAIELTGLAERAEVERGCAVLERCARRFEVRDDLVPAVL